MKKSLLCFVVIVCLLVLCGCSGSGSPEDRTADFYYIQSDIDLENPQSVIITENRDAGPMQDLTALLNLYLQGPLDDSLRSPFPVGTTLVRIEEHSNYLEVTLSPRLANLTGIELTLACSCIAKTCMGLTDAPEIRISADQTTLDGASYIAITADSLLLTGDGAQ